MSRNPADIPTLRLVYDYRPNENIRAQQGLVYKAGGDRELLFDVDVPEFQAGRNQPVVVFVHGDGPTQMIEHIKDWNVYRDWGGLIAAYGMVAVTFNHRASSGGSRLQDGAADVKELVHTVRDRADEFGIDADRFAIWVCSGGAPFVLPWIIRERPEYIRCAAALYTRLDLRDPTPSEVQTARTANTFSPLKSLEVAQRPVLPMLLVRAGLDQPELNGSIDRFVAAALARNEDIELVNYSGGHHAFDIIDDTGRSRQIITRIVEFFRINPKLSIMSP